MSTGMIHLHNQALCNPFPPPPPSPCYPVCPSTWSPVSDTGCIIRDSLLSRLGWKTYCDLLVLISTVFCLSTKKESSCPWVTGSSTAAFKKIFKKAITYDNLALVECKWEVAEDRYFPIWIINVFKKLCHLLIDEYRYGACLFLTGSIRHGKINKGC